MKKRVKTIKINNVKDENSESIINNTNSIDTSLSGLINI